VAIAVTVALLVIVGLKDASKVWAIENVVTERSRKSVKILAIETV
jgi:hypothetical protein